MTKIMKISNLFYLHHIPVLCKIDAINHAMSTCQYELDISTSVSLPASHPGFYEGNFIKWVLEVFISI